MKNENASKTLHDACYRGDLRAVRVMLDDGADPNAPADASERPWVSSAGHSPLPLSCVVIAKSITEAHVEIAKLLLARGARVDGNILRDVEVQSLDRPHDRALRRMLLAACPS